MSRTLQRRIVTMGILFTVASSVIASGAAVALHITKPSETIMRGVYVAGAHVGQLTPDQAERFIDTYIQALVDLPIVLRVAEQQWQVPARELGVNIRLDEMVSRAFEVGRRGSYWQQMKDRLHVARRGAMIPVLIQFDEHKLDEWLDRIASEIEREPQDARINVLDRGAEIVSAAVGYRLDRQEIARAVQKAATRLDRRIVYLTLEEISPGLPGVEDSFLGMNHLMGAFTTYFDPSDENRTENIRIAARTLDGMVLAPKEEFSFNRTVGPRIESEGYREAPVIIDGELVPDIGGGVCQVSSTLYNAVLLAGLKVTHRIPHSIPSTYVPLGFDAAVAYDFIDFRFANSTENPVLIRAKVDHDRVILAFYGPDPRYDSVRLESEIVEILEPNVVENASSSLSPGERRVTQHGRHGYRVNVWRITEQHGAQERSLVSRTVYRPRDRVVLTGAVAEL